MPSFATVSFANKADYTWVPSTTDARALTRVAGTTGYVAAWYGTSFDINVGLNDGQSHQVALEFLTGYLVEYSLSVDNIFVFVLVLRYFAVPAAQQHRVLFYGILGALVFRGAFIVDR